MSSNRYVKKLLAAVLALVLCIPIFLSNAMEVKADDFGVESYTFECQDADGNVITSAKPGDVVFVVFKAKLKEGWWVDEGERPLASLDPTYSKYDGQEKWNRVGLESTSYGDTGYSMGRSSFIIPEDVNNTTVYFWLRQWLNPPNSHNTENRLYRISLPIGDTVSTDSTSSISGNVPQREDSQPAQDTDTTTETMTYDKPANMVQGTNGKRLISTTGGSYYATTVNGVAVTTAKTEVMKAVGVTEEDEKQGTNIGFYFCDTWGNKELKNSLKSAAEELEKNVMTYINADLYSITPKGKITKLRNASAPVNIVFGVPESLAKAENDFSVICLVDGKPVIMQDLDSDPRTITINTSVFGVYAIVY